MVTLSNGSRTLDLYLAGILCQSPSDVHWALQGEATAAPRDHPPPHQFAETAQTLVLMKIKIMLHKSVQKEQPELPPRMVLCVLNYILVREKTKEIKCKTLLDPVVY